MIDTAAKIWMPERSRTKVCPSRIDIHTSSSRHDFQQDRIAPLITLNPHLSTTHLRPRSLRSPSPFAPHPPSPPLHQSSQSAHLQISSSNSSNMRTGSRFASLSTMCSSVFVPWVNSSIARKRFSVKTWISAVGVGEGEREWERDLDILTVGSLWILRIRMWLLVLECNVLL